MKIVIPPSGLIRAFTDLVQPMFDRINRNIEQSRTLANLRDTLLPKLLSGELRVQTDSGVQQSRLPGCDSLGKADTPHARRAATP